MKSRLTAFAAFTAINLVITVTTTRADTALAYLGRWSSNGVDVGRIALSDSHAYVLTTNGFITLSITNPALPLVQSTWAFTNDAFASDIAEYNGYVYVNRGAIYHFDFNVDPPIVIDDPYSLYAVNVSDPTAPTNTGIAASETIPWYAGSGNLAVESGRVYIAAAGPLLVYSTVNPGSPQFLCDESTGYHQDICVESNRAFVVGDIPGYQEFDFTVPCSPIVGTDLSMPGYDSHSVSKRGDYAYFVNYSDETGDSIVTIQTSLLAPTTTSSIAVGGVGDLCITTNNLLVALTWPTNAAPGISIYSLQTPDSPALESHWEFADASRVECQGDLVAVSAGTNGLFLFKTMADYVPSISGILMGTNTASISWLPVYNRSNALLRSTDLSTWTNLGIATQPWIDLSPPSGDKAFYRLIEYR